MVNKSSDANILTPPAAVAIPTTSVPLPQSKNPKNLSGPDNGGGRGQRTPHPILSLPIPRFPLSLFPTETGNRRTMRMRRTMIYFSKRDERYWIRNGL